MPTEVQSQSVFPAKKKLRPKSKSSTSLTSLINPVVPNERRQCNTGPEGIGVWPHFDRDYGDTVIRDNISDLIEAVNYRGVLRQNLTTDYLNPLVGDTVDSRAGNNTLIGGFKLPSEGIGYRHFYSLANE